MDGDGKAESRYVRRRKRAPGPESKAAQPLEGLAQVQGSFAGGEAVRAVRQAPCLFGFWHQGWGTST